MAAKRSASLIVEAPSGQVTRVSLAEIPFSIGRQADNQLVLRDNRASRRHARIIYEGGSYVIEDLKSRHGIWVNGKRVARQTLREADRIDIGLADSYHLTFTQDKEGFRRVLSQFSTFLRPEARTGDLAKLHSLVEVARALENSLSTEEVLSAIVDAALTVTGYARGFLLLRSGKAELSVRVARDRFGRNLDEGALQVSTDLLLSRLSSRRELLFMSFENGGNPSGAIAEAGGSANSLCLPLIRMRGDSGEETRATSTAEETVGLIYMDSKETADLSEGSRELLETLAIEASTILQNAWLIEEQRSKIRMENELQIARGIQRGLQPVSLPSAGWFRAAGSSRASMEVGGDYYDVHQISATVWTAILADVSGKGVSSALLASLLQGTFLMSSADPAHIGPRMARLNEFMLERTKGEKYVTVFYCLLEDSGRLSYSNAGQCAPLLISRDGSIKSLESTSMPVGMLETAPFDMAHIQLAAGDKLVMYSDGVTEAGGADGLFFGNQRLRQCLRKYASASAQVLHDALMNEVDQFTLLNPDGPGVVHDDITALVIEYGA